MSKPRIAIVGTGFIGTSIGLALKARKAAWELVGHDKELSAAKQAKKLGAVDKVEWNLINACDRADFIVLAIPLPAIKDTFTALAQDLKEGCTIVDTANLKQPVLAWADEILPSTVNFVGGDPIVTVALEERQPSAALFQNRLYCLTPAPAASEQAVESASAFVIQLGATPYFIDAAEHDGIVAGVDHLPYILAVVLAQVTTNAPSWREARKVAGQAYLTATQPLAAAPESYPHVCRDNQANLIRWIDGYISHLQNIRQLIADGNLEELEKTLDAVFAARAKWLRDVGVGDWDDVGKVEVPKQRGVLKQLFGVG